MALVHNTSGHPILGRRRASEVKPGDRVLCSQQICEVLRVVDHPPVPSDGRRDGPVKHYMHAIQIVTAHGSRWAAPDFEILLYGARETP